MNRTTPLNLAVRVICYYLAVTIGMVAIVAAFPQSSELLPLGSGQRFSLTGMMTGADGSSSGLPNQFTAALILVTYMVGAVIAVLPVTWIYMASHQDSGYKSPFVQTLVVLPICSTTAVLGIKDSLALAFGLAALVAAVRFRVRLRDSLDGVYVLAAVTIGLLTGIGYLAAALVLTFFFTMVNLGLWSLPINVVSIGLSRCLVSG